MIEKISTRQIILVITISRIATILTVMPIIHMGPANQDIWIMIILSFFYTILTNIPLLFLSKRFDDLTIIGYMKKIFGKIIGTIIGLIYVLAFIRTASFAFYVATQMIRTAFMMDLTPIIIIAVLAIIFIYITSRGLEVLVRTAELMGPIIIVFLIIFMILGYNNIDFSILRPIYSDSTFSGLNLGALQIALIFTDLYILSMTISQLENKKDINKILIKSIVYSLLIILMMVVVTQSSLGIEQARHSNYPFLIYVRIVRTYSIFERIESAFLVIWTLSVMIRISAYLSIASYALKEIFNKKNVNIFVYIVTIIAASIAYYRADIAPPLGKVIQTSLLEYIYYSIFKIGIPLIAIIIYLFRRKSFEKQVKLGN